VGDAIKVLRLGRRGVNVDLNPLELTDDDLVRASNAFSNESTIRKRPGLIAFTTTATAGIVVGGVDLPLQDLLNGMHFIYIGRGPSA
jgi:hypothetical protein